MAELEEAARLAETRIAEARRRAGNERSAAASAQMASQQEEKRGASAERGRTAALRW